MASEILTLGFDTSAAHCAAALLRGDTPLAERFEAMSRGQVERLMPLLEEMLAGAGAGLGWHDLGALGVGTGPGNFTGVRISVAAARGLALSLGIPAIGVTTLEARALGLPRPLWVVEDARRGEVYLQKFGKDGASEPVLLPLTDLPGLRDDAETPLFLTGDAASPAAELLGREGAHVLPEAMPLATAIARIACARVGAGTPVARPKPLYLRGADAAPPSDPPPAVID